MTYEHRSFVSFFCFSKLTKLGCRIRWCFNAKKLTFFLHFEVEKAATSNATTTATGTADDDHNYGNEHASEINDTNLQTF